MKMNPPSQEMGINNRILSLQNARYDVSKRKYGGKVGKANKNNWECYCLRYFKIYIIKNIGVALCISSIVSMRTLLLPLGQQRAKRKLTAQEKLSSLQTFERKENKIWKGRLQQWWRRWKEIGYNFENTFQLKVECIYVYVDVYILGLEPPFGQAPAWGFLWSVRDPFPMFFVFTLFWR